MQLITLEDFRDIYLKIAQRGFSFFLSKFSLNSDARTKSSFDDLSIQAANWWIIPAVRERWNKMITGNSKVTYEEFITNEILNTPERLKLLSLGSGICSHEIRLAELNPYWKLTCVDFSAKLINKAKETAENRNLRNINFIADDIYTCNLPENHFDIVFFHSSLHHFKNLDTFIPEVVAKRLTNKGKLIINEYVGPNRLQFSKKQRNTINKSIQLIEPKYRLIFKSNLKKNKFYGSGILRMLISDPTECVDSESILPVIRKHFDIIIEKPFGGNLLMNALKDISHHFVNSDNEKRENLQRIFEFEDKYIAENQSDFLFGVYEKRG